MAAQNPPSFMQNVATETAAQARNMLAGFIAGQGVVSTGDLLVAQRGAGANMSVDVAAGAVFLKGTENALQGVYHAFNDATTNLVIAASDPTNPRIDRVVAKVQDAFYSGATNAWSMAVVTGTPTSGATLVNLNGVGAAPASSLTLAYVLVPAASSSVINANISDQRNRSVGNGAGGMLINGYAQVTASQGPFTAETTLTGLTVTVNVPSGRRLKITAQTPLNSTADTDIVQANIKESTTVLGLGLMVEGAVSGTATVVQSVIITPTAGQHTYFLTAQRNSGTGNVTLNAGSTFPAFILVEDIGPV